MLTRIWNTLPKFNRAHDRPRRAERLSALVEEEGCIQLGRELPAALGMNRRQAVQAAYDLALEERAQLRADGAGQLQVMSNRLFNRMIMEALFGKEACIVDEIPETLREAEAETTIPEMYDAAAEGVVELPWYAVGIVPAEAESADNREMAVFGRQTLPDRKREPWVAMENPAEKKVKERE